MKYAVSYYLLVLSFFSISSSFSQTATAPPGSGTSGAPYLISSLENLYWIAATDAVVPSPDRSTRWSAVYEQTADIDASPTQSWFSGVGWPRIGIADNPFTGSYDGGGHTISGLYINAPSQNEVSLFGEIGGTSTQSVIIENLRIENANITGRGDVGALVGRAFQWNEIILCFSSGTVSGLSNVGGLVGFGNRAEFSKCGSTANVSGTNLYQGGLIGHINSGSRVEQSFAKGNVSGNSRVGGLIGATGFGVQTEDSYARGNVSSNTSNPMIGGLIGEVFQSGVRNSFSTGFVDLTGVTQDFGGLVGLKNTGGPFFDDDNYWDEETSGLTTSELGSPLTTAQSKAESSYNNWDFVPPGATTGIWRIDGATNDGYPYLAFEERFVTWTGNTSDDWHTASNWEDNEEPQPGFTILIPSGTPNEPTVSQNTTCDALIVEPGAEVTVTSGNTFTIEGAISNGGSITIENEASLVQESTINHNSGNGDYIVERTGRSNNMEYNGWSAPIAGQSIHDNNGVFEDDNACDLFVFDGSVQNWRYDFPVGYQADCGNGTITFGSGSVISSGDGIMTTARGYLAPGNSTSTRVFQGSNIHNGPYSYTLENGTLPTGVNWTDDDWNLVGNPYPSAIDIISFLNTNSSVLQTQTVYVWSDDGSQGASYTPSDYIAVNSSGGTAGGGSLNITNGSIASCQGFVVQASSGGGTLQFTNEMRVADNNDQFRSRNDDVFDRFWISASTDSARSEILIAFRTGADRGFDPEFDAPKKIVQTHLNLAGKLSTGEDMCILGEAPLQYGDSVLIPLNVQTESKDKIEISLQHSEFPVNPSTEVYLIDYLRKDTSLLQKENYSFSADQGTTLDERFALLVVNDDPMSTAPPKTAEKKPVEIYMQNKTELFVLSPQDEIKRVEMFDLSGRHLLSRDFRGSEQQVVPVGNAGSGVYLVRVLTKKGNVTVKKIPLR